MSDEKGVSHSTGLDLLAGALAKAQGEMGNARKDAENPFFKSTYPTLGAVRDASQDALAKNGLSVIQGLVKGESILATTLLHSSGQSFTTYYPFTPVKHDPQGEGSAMTYSRRYSLMAILGLASEDDDGNKGSGLDNKKGSPQGEKQKPGGLMPDSTRPPGTIKPGDRNVDINKRGIITDKQIGRLFAIANSNGWKDFEVEELMVNSIGDLAWQQRCTIKKYEDACTYFMKNKPTAFVPTDADFYHPSEAEVLDAGK